MTTSFNFNLKTRHVIAVVASMALLGLTSVTSLAKQNEISLDAVSNSSAGVQNANNNYDRIIVKFKDKTSDAEKKQVENLVGSKSNHIKDDKLKVNNETIYNVKNLKDRDSILKSLKNNPDIQYAEPDLKYSLNDPAATTFATVTTNDYLNQWHLSNIQAPNAWSVSTGQNVLVAVCDTGVQRNHPDLANNIRADLGFNIFTGTSTGWDVLENPHGTMVSGTIAEIANNTIGGKGVAFNTKIIPLKVSSDSSGSTYTSYLASCIQYAADKGAKVINVSYDVAGSSSIAYAAVYANSKGASVVVAAGNSASNLGYSNYPSIISVSATNEFNTLAGFSDYGRYVDFSAPGTNIITTYWNGGYASVNGTSFSSPITAATIALMLQVKPNLTPAQLQSVLQVTSTDLGPLGYDIQYGYGKINAANAVSYVLNNRI